MKKIFFLLSLFSIQFIESQTLEKKFVGCWGDTTWTFEFFKNSKYKRTSSGHYGNTIVSGKYIMINDSIQMKSGFDNTHGTVNEYYFIDKNNVLIDTDSGYGYPVFDVEQTTLYCDLKYPDIISVNKEEVILIEKALNIAFNSEKIKDYYHFDTLPKRKLLITKYKELHANIVVDDIVAEFKPIEEITEDFYIEIEKIELYNSNLNLKIKLHDEGVSFRIHFKLIDNEWIQNETIEIEN